MGFQLFLCRTAESYCSLVRCRLLNLPQTVHYSVGTRIAQNVKYTYKSTPNVRNISNVRSSSGVLFVLCGRIFRLEGPRNAFSTSTQVLKDVVLFHHDRTGFFRLLAIFCCGQFLFWTYLAHFAFTGLRDTGAPKEQRQIATTGLAGPWSFEMNLGSNAWRYGFTVACLAIGGGIVGLGAMFCSRSISKVVLHKGGRMVTVSTQSPLGPDKGRTITVPLSQVACHAHRQEAPSFIPLKVKGHKFYFLLDKDGTLNNPKLFDVTVGAYRAF